MNLTWFPTEDYGLWIPLFGIIGIIVMLHFMGVINLYCIMDFFLKVPKKKGEKGK